MPLRIYNKEIILNGFTIPVYPDYAFMFSEDVAYDKMYLSRVVDKHKMLFQDFSKSKYDLFDFIKAYMISWYRIRMDAGHPLALLEYVKKLRSCTLDENHLVEHKGKIKYDPIVINWIAEAYVVLQWKYKVSSVELVNKIPPELLYERYSPLHECSWEALARKTILSSNVFNEHGVIGFHDANEQYGFLSNWYLSHFSIDGVEYSSMEQFIMHQKALLFNDVEVADKILHEFNQANIKALGREVKNFKDSAWIARRHDILQAGLYAKFSQNKVLKEALLNTGDTTLVELAKNDLIYGVGCSSKTSEWWKPTNWRGQNLLGLTLMEVREMVQKME